MVAWTRGGRSGRWVVVAMLGLATGFVACATSVTEEGGALSAGKSLESTEPGGLSDVLVEQQGKASVLTLVGLEDPAFTAFLHEDPSTLVLDFASVSLSSAENPIVVYDGLVEQVSLSSFESETGESMTRLEVSLSETAEYEVEPGANGLVVRLWPSGTVAELDTGVSFEDTSPASDEPDESAAEADPWASDTVAPLEEGTETDPEAHPAAPATTLSQVEVTQTAAGVLIHLGADGAVGAMETFTLENPNRLVVDLPGLASEVPESQLKVDTEWVSRIRVGAHADKVRVVIDGGSAVGVFEGRRVMPSADGLYVTLGSGSDLDTELETRVAAASAAQQISTTSKTQTEDASKTQTEDVLAIAQDAIAQELGEVAEAQDEIEEITEIASVTQAAGTATVGAVHGIHFDSQPDRDRVVVLSDGIVDYVVHKPDAETVVLSIPGASIAREAEGRITPEIGGPISLVTTFAQPDVPGGEVRVVMKRAPNLEPMVSRHGSLLFIDFENTGVAAAAPPAFEEMQSPEDTSTLAVVPAAPGDPASFQSIEADGEIVVAAANSVAVEALDGVAGLEIQELDDLPQFTGSESSPASVSNIDLGGPASLEPPASVDLLEEGGLIDGKEYRGRRISLDFKDVQIADVLRIIAEVSDLNVVAGEEVSGTVTIRLVDVPWDQALDVILLTKGLGFVRVGNVLRIAPAEIISQEEEVRLQERRNKEKLEDLVVKLQPINYADVEDAAALVEKLLTARGSVNVDKRTNTLILKDIASVVDEASALVMAVDTQTPQVMIEAKIVEANLDFSRELGSVWAFGANPFKDGFNPNAGPRTNLGDDDFLFHDSNNVIFANPITSLASGLGTLNAFILDEKFNLSVSLAAAESKGDGKVISSPRIVTLDNREASIEQGVSIPFQTFEGGDAKLEFIDAVLRLGVTPHISADKSIVMQIEVQRNAPDDSIPTPTGSPAIAKNEAQTETLVKDGQTLVIGGIYTVVQTTRESRVPYLHKLPLIGNAFRSKEVTDSRKELLIFVTPRIVTLPESG